MVLSLDITGITLVIIQIYAFTVLSVEEGLENLFDLLDDTLNIIKFIDPW